MKTFSQHTITARKKTIAKQRFHWKNQQPRYLWMECRSMEFYTFSCSQNRRWNFVPSDQRRLKQNSIPAMFLVFNKFNLVHHNQSVNPSATAYCHQTTFLVWFPFGFGWPENFKNRITSETLPFYWTIIDLYCTKIYLIQNQAITKCCS